MIAIVGREVDPRGTSAIAPFCIDATEVTTTAFGGCVAEGKCGVPSTWDNADSVDRVCNWKRPGAALHPINCVEPSDAKKYCAWIGRRLPSDDEFDWVAHGGPKRTPFPWGDDKPDARVCGTTTNTCEVGASKGDTTPEGVKDLAGNLAELVDFPDGAKNVAIYGTWFGAGAAAVNGSPRGGAVNEANTGTGFRCAKNL
jgi:formylglycine-generating enzyme required for sulfatase activity